MSGRAIMALAWAQALDLSRRASTRLLAAAGVLLILSLRYFSAFGLGYEVVQLEELGVYTLGMMGAPAVVLFCLPREEASARAEELLLVSPVPTPAHALGVWLGRVAAMLVLALLWAGAIVAALWWFSVSEPRLFSWRRATTIHDESLRLAAPVLGQMLTLAVLLALTQPLARLGRPTWIVAGFAALYAVGFAAPALGWPWRAVLPDFDRYDLTAMLWGQAQAISTAALLAHAAAWCTVGLALDAAALRAKLA